VSVENKTSSLTVVSRENKGRIREIKERGLGDLSLFNVTLKNDYNVPIAVYASSVWDETLNERTGSDSSGTFLTRWTVKPGQQILTNFVTSVRGNATFTIEAVVFEDGSGDGDSDALAQLLEQRTGASLAYQKLIPALKEALKTSGMTGTAAGLASLRKSINNTWPEHDASDSVTRGFTIAKGYISMSVLRIEHLMNSGQSPNVRELLTDKVSEMEAGLKRFSETTPVKTASLRRNK
jgi:hypothetical protein